MRTRLITREDLDTAPDWFAEIELRPDRWRDEHTRSIVAVDGDGAPIAAGIIWTSRVHGDRYWVAVAVDPARRRRGIGREVIAALVELRAAPLPFMTRGFVGTPELAFADALGARTIQVVPPTQVRVAAREALREVTAQTVPGTAVGPQVLGEAWASAYAWSHADWSPVGPGFAEALREDFENEVDLEASSVTLDEHGGVTAVCVVFADEAPVLCGETVRREQLGGERLVESCLRRSLDVLAGRGADAVELDGHVSDPHWFPAWIRLDPSGRWFRLVEIEPSRR